MRYRVLLGVSYTCSMEGWGEAILLREDPGGCGEKGVD